MALTRRSFGKLAAAGAVLLPGLRTAGASTITRSHGVSAFGDLKYPSDFAHFDYVNPDAPVGGTFSSVGTAARSTFDSLNPFILKGVAAQGMGLTFDTLMISATDEPDAVYGLLAEAIEYPEDRTFATFDLRPEATFSDGTPVTAEDVAFSLEVLKEKGSPRLAILYRDILSTTVEGPHRIRFDFDPNAPTRDMPMLAAAIPIFSAAYWSTRDFAESTLEPPLGSGAYAVDKVEPGRFITYRRRPDYWGWNLPVMQGQYNFETVRYEYFRERVAAFEAFKGGGYTFHEEFFSKLWATAYDFPAIQRGDVIREQIPDDRTAGAQGYWFNLRRPQFADPRVREAIALGFDFEWSNETLFYGLYQRTDSFFEGGPMQAETEPTAGERAVLERVAGDLPPGLFDEPAYSPPTTDGSGRNRRNLRRASALLDEAGWTVGNNGIRQNAAGETLSFEFVDDSPAFERITGPYVDNLKKLGLDVTARTIDAAQFQRRMKEFDFDLTVRRYSMSLTPGTELRGIFHSESADLPDSSNIMGLKHPAVDGILDIIAKAESRETLSDAVKALDRVLRALHIWVPQWTKSSHTIAYWDIYGRPETKPKYDRGVIATWWIDADKDARLKAEGRL